ncbi:MAG: hypothetical protein K6U02_02425 [Firmicutes bacterium]|nr:hypothetical protein [Bacillota bacterium]
MSASPQGTESKSGEKIVVPAGTRLALILHNSVSTRQARSGLAVYLETTFPVVQNGRILIPAGSYVSGEIVEAKRPGRVKGRAELMIRLNTLVLPNGYSVDFNAVPENAGTGGNESVNSEGTIKGDTDKSADVATVVTTTALGLGIGSATTLSGKGAAVGAAAGAGVGLLAVLASRGPEAELPRGSTIEAVLTRPLYLDAEKIQFTDPGKASLLPGPENRRPERRRFPY